MNAVFVQCPGCCQMHSYPLGPFKVGPAEIIKCKCGTITPPPRGYWQAADYAPSDGDFTDYWIIPLRDEDGFIARIRRTDGHDILHKRQWHPAISTANCQDRESAIEQATLLIGSGELK